MAHPAFVELCLELLAPLGAVRTRRMFGSHGLYAQDLFIAILSGDRLYLKTDDQSRAAFDAAGGQPFVYEARGRRVALSFCTVPPDALDSPHAMAPWAALALQAARRARRDAAMAPMRQRAPSPATARARR